MRILLVEDTPSIARVFSHVMIKHGHDVKIVDTSVQALFALQDGGYEFVLTDHELRDGARGLLVIEYLRGFAIQVPRCLTSGGDLVGERSVQGPYKTFRSKPFGAPTLIEILSWAQRIREES